MLDLPSLHTCPSATKLLETLDALAIKLSTFDGAVDDDESHKRRVGATDGLPRYLTSIVSNALDWIEDEPTRERIWETASERLSERSGRTGWSLSASHISQIFCRHL